MTRRRLTPFVGVVALVASIAAAVGSTRAPAAPPPDPGARGPYSVRTASYDFGDSVFRPRGFVADVEVRGRAYYPKNLPGRFPLVVFLHGRHSVCYHPDTGAERFEWPCTNGTVPIPSHLGYAEAASLLASHGYVVVSISANAINYFDDFAADLGANARGQLVLHHLDRWRRWSSVGGSPFSERFVGHVDLSRIGLMGHSRGGEGVVAAATINQGLGSPYSIRALLPLAPTDFSRLVARRIPLAVVLPYCDGDVSDLQGIHFVDDAMYGDRFDPDAKHVVTVMGANHNFFNTVWTPSEFSAGSFDDWFDDADPHCGPSAPSSGRLGAAEQRRVGAIASTAFFHRYLGGETRWDPYLDGSWQRPASLAGVDVRVSRHAMPRAARRDVAKFSSASELSTNLLGGATQAWAFDELEVCGGVAPAAVHCLGEDESWDRDPHTTPSFLAPDRRGTGTLRATWDGSGAVLRMSIPSRSRDLSGFSAVTLRAAVDFTDPRNLSGRPQDFTLRLEDTRRRAATVAVSRFSPALRSPPGTRDFSFSPVPKVLRSSVRIPLGAFAGIDTTHLRAVSLVFDRTPRGSLLVSDLAFSR